MNSSPASLAPPAHADLAPPLLPSARELTFTEAAKPGEAPAALLGRLADRLDDARADLIGLMVFGSVSILPKFEATLRELLREKARPILWVDGASCHGATLAGVQAFALAGALVEPVAIRGHVVAARYRIGDTELCWVGGTTPPDAGAAPREQTTRAFHALGDALHAAGFGLRDLVRTWCYNRDLLGWYSEFNHARSALYHEVGFRLGATPASTGISAANPAGTALVLAGLAARPRFGGDVARVIASPLQCPAPAYGSAFSRAVELDLGARRRLIVSGTASIEPGGATVWRDDIVNQVELTMQVIEAILASRGLAWRDVTRGIAYFKSPGFTGVFEAWCRRRGWSDPPVLNLHCDICRDDLLFELEVDAEAPA